MTTTFRNILAVCSVATCGAFFNPTVAGEDASGQGRCVRCRVRGAKAAVKITYAERKAPAQAQVAPARTTVRWADESNGVCNRCAGTGEFKSFGSCFRCQGTGVAPGAKKSAAVAEVEATIDAAYGDAEEVVLDLGYERPAFLAQQADREVKLRFSDYTALQAEIVMRRAAYLVSRKGITRAVGSQLQTPMFVREGVTAFQVIPF